MLVLPPKTNSRYPDHRPLRLCVCQTLKSVRSHLCKSIFFSLINEALILEEKFPKGTSVKAWMNGGYAFEMSLLNGNDLFVGSAFSHENGADYVRGGNGNDTFIGY